MSLAISAASLAILLFIALELLVVIRELARQPRPVHSDEKKEGQTINVNVAALPPQDQQSHPGRPEQATPQEEPASIEAPPAASPQSEGAPHRPAPPPPAQARVAPSGQMVVKCPRCKSENSSYRSECFNCGEKL